MNFCETIEYKRAFEVSLGPQYEDIATRDALRLDFRAKYGITERWMVGARLRTFLNNPVTDKDVEGLSGIRLETKYRWPEDLLPPVQIATGVEFDIPLTDDEDLSDGIYHLVPYVTFMKVFKTWQHMHVYAQIGVDVFLGAVSPRDVIEERVELAETFLIVAPGIIFPWPPFYYFLDLEWNTTGKDHVLFITPGVRWEIPRLTWLPGLWTVELGPRFGLLAADGEYDMAFRVLLEFGPRQRQQPQERTVGKRLPRSEQLGQMSSAFFRLGRF